MTRLDSSIGETRLIVLPEASALEYCPNSEFERIWRPIANKIPYLLVGFIVLIGFLAQMHWLEPTVLFLGRLLLTPLKPLLQGTGNAAAAAVIGTISNLSMWVYAAVGFYVAKLAIVRSEQPTHIGISRTALLLTQIQKTGSYWVTRTMPWEDVLSISVERPRGTKSANDYRIILQGRHLSTSIKYGDILKPADRDKFLQTLKVNLPERAFAQKSPEELFSVFKPARASEGFTELWLKELAAPPKREKLTPLLPGMRLQNGEYLITDKLGTGGQGTVYLAQTNKFGQPNTVALKEFVMPVFPDARVRRTVAEKFQQEAEMLSRINHPQIVKLFDVFVEDHRAYLVMERISGKTLKRLVGDRGPLFESEVVRYALQMCDILSYLHTQQPPVVHRDFTPDNLMVSETGKICLIDFSVAQQIEINITGSVVGKHLYMSPEQFRGKTCPASDIYSLGASLFYLLTGHEPEAISVAHPKKLNESVTEQMDALVATCTAIDADQRGSLMSIVVGLEAMQQAKDGAVKS